MFWYFFYSSRLRSEKLFDISVVEKVTRARRIVAGRRTGVQLQLCLTGSRWPLSLDVDDDQTVRSHDDGSVSAVRVDSDVITWTVPNSRKNASLNKTDFDRHGVVL